MRLGLGLGLAEYFEGQARRLQSSARRAALKAARALLHKAQADTLANAAMRDVEIAIGTAMLAFTTCLEGRR